MLKRLIGVFSQKQRWRLVCSESQEGPKRPEHSPLDQHVLRRGVPLPTPPQPSEHFEADGRREVWRRLHQHCD